VHGTRRCSQRAPFFKLKFLPRFPPMKNVLFALFHLPSPGGTPLLISSCFAGAAVLTAIQKDTFDTFDPENTVMYTALLVFVSVLLLGTYTFLNAARKLPEGLVCFG
jgi:hypothetical protein